MQRLRGVSIALTVVAAFALVFYNGASRWVEIGLFAAFAVLLALVLQFNKAPRQSDGASGKQVDARQIICWIFACMAVKYVVFSMQIAEHRRYAHMPLLSWVTVILYAIVPIVSALAWWTVWKHKPLARRWGITASILYLLVFLHIILFFPTAIWWQYSSLLIAGVAGIVILLHSDKQNKCKTPVASISA
jgi:hypothetical protein